MNWKTRHMRDSFILHNSDFFSIAHSPKDASFQKTLANHQASPRKRTRPCGNLICEGAFWIVPPFKNLCTQRIRFCHQPPTLSSKHCLIENFHISKTHSSHEFWSCQPILRLPMHFLFPPSKPHQWFETIALIFSQMPSGS
jgi:hypothetical protein